MSADSRYPSAIAKHAERYDTELAAGFWRHCDPWIAIAAIAASLLTAVAAVYWMPVLTPA